MSPTGAVVRRLCRALALAALPMSVGCGGPRTAPPAPAVERMRYDADGHPTRPVRRRISRPMIVLICLDTVRADALAPWAKGPPAMPETSKWLESATVFRDAHAAASWTAPSVASLLSGLLPSNHGVRELDSKEENRLVPAVPTLAEILASKPGSVCGAMTGGGWVSERHGMLQGFAAVSSPFSFGARADAVLANHRALSARESAAYFLFLHTYEAHDPYGSPPADRDAVQETRNYSEAELREIDEQAKTDGGRELTRRFLLDPPSRTQLFDSIPGRRRMPIVTNWLEYGPRDDPAAARLIADARRGYERGLRALDRALARYLNGLDADHGLDDTVIVLCSDHGEGFGEHGAMHHGRRVYTELTHVPFAIRAKGFPRGAIIDDPCSLLDVAPTVLELCGLLVAEGMDGRSLVPLVNGSAATGRVVISEERRTPATGTRDDSTLTAVRDRTTTWIGTRDRRTGELTEEIFDRRTDPGEERPLPVESTLARASAELQAEVGRQRRDGVR